jgi:hypothetical protein
MRRVMLLLVVLSLAACGRTDDDVATIVQLGSDALPTRIHGLTVEHEDVEERIAGVNRTYIESTGLYTLREGKKLQGTLQVSRFNDDVDPTDERFRLSLVNQIGSTEPKAFRMGDHVVYLTASKRQAVAVFFTGTAFGVLSTLETYEESRALLRDVLELEL